MELADFSKYKNFQSFEFDSPDVGGSGKNMTKGFMDKLQSVRNIVDFPLNINSGFRTLNHNEHLIRRGLKASRNSYHLKGRAADIGIPTNSRMARTRGAIIQAAIEVGFKGIGVGRTFIHLDDRRQKHLDIWTY